MIDSLKLYLGLGPTEDYVALSKRARKLNFAVIFVVVLIALSIDTLWLRITCFVILFLLSVIVSLVSRDAERAQRPH